jgi:Smg protein
MKDNWIELLFSLFEKSLSQLKKEHALNSAKEILTTPMEDKEVNEEPLVIQAKDRASTRVLSPLELSKLTKSSHQFLMRMKLLGVLSSDSFEQIMHILQFSDSRIITLEETKWAIRKVLAIKLDSQQLAFLDLVLYHKELGIVQQ